MDEDSTGNLYDWPPLTLWLTGLILALVVFVIVLPAVCTACYHWYAYRKGWDDDVSQCESDCSGCAHESAEEKHFRQRERWRYICRMLQANARAGIGLQEDDADGLGNNHI